MLSAPSRLSGYAGGYFRVYERVCILRGNPPRVKWVGGKGGAQAAGGEGPAHDATVTMPPFLSCPNRQQHDFREL